MPALLGNPEHGKEMVWHAARAGISAWRIFRPSVGYLVKVAWIIQVLREIFADLERCAYAQGWGIRPEGQCIILRLPLLMLSVYLWYWSCCWTHCLTSTLVWWWCYHVSRRLVKNRSNYSPRADSSRLQFFPCDWPSVFLHSTLQCCPACPHSRQNRTTSFPPSRINAVWDRTGWYGMLHFQLSSSWAVSISPDLRNKLCNRSGKPRGRVGAGSLGRMFLGWSDSLAWDAFPCHLSAEPCVFSASLPLFWRKQQDLTGLRRTWRAERTSWIWSAKKGNELFLTHKAVTRWPTFHCICWDKMRNGANEV